MLLIAPIVDPTLIRDTDASLEIAFDVLNDMAAVGNSIAASRKTELQQLKDVLAALEGMGQHVPLNIAPLSEDQAVAPPAVNANQVDTVSSGYSEFDFLSAQSFDTEEILSSEQLEAVANAMDLSGLDWAWAASSLEQLDPSLL